MRKSLHIITALLVVASIAASAFAADTTEARAAGVVNINTAEASQIANLPRIGLKAAQRVIDYREEHGAFKKVTDLMQVKGFGQKTYDLVSQYVTVDGKTTLSEKIRSPRKPRASKASKSRPTSAS